MNTPIINIGDTITYRLVATETEIPTEQGYSHEWTGKVKSIHLKKNNEIGITVEVTFGEFEGEEDFIYFSQVITVNGENIQI